MTEEPKQPTVGHYNIPADQNKSATYVIDNGYSPLHGETITISKDSYSRLQFQLKELQEERDKLKEDIHGKSISGHESKGDVDAYSEGYLDQIEDLKAKLAASETMIKKLVDALASVQRHGLIEQDGYETVLRQLTSALSEARQHIEPN